MTEQTLFTSYKVTVDLSWTSVDRNTRQLCHLYDGSAMLKSVRDVRVLLSTLISVTFANKIMNDRRQLPTGLPILTHYLRAENESSHHVNLVVFQRYSSCRFPFEKSSVSSASNSSGFTKDSSVTWSVECLAPEKTDTDGIGRLCQKMPPDMYSLRRVQAW